MNFKLEETFKVPPKQIYECWLDSEKHSIMTGGEAKMSNVIDAIFTAWDGYIQGKNKALEPYKKIVQSWRTSQFKEGQPDSLLTIDLLPFKNGTKLILKHENLTEKDHHYKDGWIAHYFEPMKKYFI